MDINIVMCKNGHFFDSYSYERCPVCGEAEGSASQEKKSSSAGNSTPGKKKKPGLLERMKNKVPNVPDRSSKAPESEEKSSTSGKGNTSDVEDNVDPFIKVPEIPQKVSRTEERDIAGGKTIDLWNEKANNFFGKGSDTEKKKEEKNIIPDNENINLPETAKPKEKVKPRKPVEQNDDSILTPPHYIKEETEEENLEEEIRKISASDEGKTVSYFNATVNSQDGNTQRSFSDPVVGWFVCISGEHTGESFCIFSGNNSIGRGSNNKIVINRDKKISREKHALVIYEPKKKMFFVQPGNGSGLTYVNDEFISSNVKLSEKDIVEIGESKLMFIPLCGESFEWTDYLK